MRKKFCPKCGKTVEKLYDNLCKDCYLLGISFSKIIPDKIIIKRCRSCGRLFSEDKEASSVENAVEIILSNILLQPEIKGATYRINKNKALINIDLKTSGLEKNEEKISDLIVKGFTCRSCSMKSLGYFNSILQIRAPENLLEPISKKVEERVNVLSRYDKFAFISKSKRVPNGIDFYIGSKQTARDIAKGLKNKFKANIKISRKLSGSISGKKVYRDTVLVSIGD